MLYIYIYLYYIKIRYHKLVSARRTQYLPRGNFLIHWLPPEATAIKIRNAASGTDSIPVQNLSRICSAVLEEMLPEQSGRQTNSNLNIS